MASSPPETPSGRDSRHESPSAADRVAGLLRQMPVVTWSLRAWIFAAVLMVALVVFSLFTNRSFLGWGVLAIVGIMVLPTSRSKAVLSAWIPYVILWFGFTFLRSFADETVLAKTGNLRVSNLERWLFGGELPSIRLQDAWYTPGIVHLWDYYFTFVHWSYFIVPHAVAAWLWWKHPALFRQYLLGLALLLGMGLMLYFAIPSNPPWMAPESVNTPSAPVVLRIMEPIAKQLGGGLYQAGYNIVGESNPIAAMPSIHFAVTFLLVWVAFTQGRRWFLLALFYAISMGIGLVYMGEHYIVDVLAGGIVTTIGWFGAGAILSRIAPRLLHRQRPHPAEISSSPISEPAFSSVG